MSKLRNTTDLPTHTPHKPLVRHVAMAARLAIGALLALSSLAAVQAADIAKKPDSIVYVGNNNADADANGILAYKRSATGRLTPLPGSPFKTHGRGVIDPTLALGPFDADQLIITNPERTLLFAVNPGSNTVAAFHIQPDGSLVDVAGSPFPSGGSNPVSLGLSRDTLVVVNKAMDPAQTAGQTPNYASFRVMPDGQLLATPLSLVGSAPGSSPSQALISPSRELVFGADFLGGLLQSFRIDPTGALVQNTPLALPASEFAGSSAPHLPLGLAVHPSRAVVYVGFVTLSKIGVYQYDATGQLGFVRSVADSGAGVCWLRTNALGTRLYASNTVDNSITVFDTTDPLNPVELQKYVMKGVGEAYQLEIDPQGEWLYAISQRNSASVPAGQGNDLHVMKIRPDGKLIDGEVTLALPLAPGIRPQGLATF